MTWSVYRLKLCRSHSSVPANQMRQKRQTKRRRVEESRSWMRGRTEAACCRDADSRGLRVLHRQLMIDVHMLQSAGDWSAAWWWVTLRRHINNMEDLHTLYTGPGSDLFRDQLSWYLFRGKYTRFYFHKLKLDKSTFNQSGSESHWY